MRVTITKLTLTFVLVFGMILIYADALVQSKFNGKRWSLPASIYARPLWLSPGEAISKNALIEELQLLGYQRNSDISQPGRYACWNNQCVVHTRSFPYLEYPVTQQQLKITFSDNDIDAIYDHPNNQLMDEYTLEPLLIGQFYPHHHEDRELVRFSDIPHFLIHSLIASEDRDFYDHAGVSIKGIARAVWVNLKTGRLQQGGSTITQQLVKNFFLTPKRTLLRKIQEAFLAIVLELRYSKAAIIEAYVNEIFLGQDGQRAIHGFGLAARYYYGRPLAQLQPEQLAMLTALVRGPSYYHPIKHPKRAKQRRNRVLEQMLLLDFIDQASFDVLTQKPLLLNISKVSRQANMPAVLDLIRRELKQYYPPKVITQSGLKIFTHIEPAKQRQAEKVLSQQLQRLPGHQQLQSALIMTDTYQGKIVAMVGDRNPRFKGFNRVLDAKRPIGSLIKPLIYLLALENPSRYSLLTKITDQPITLQQPDGSLWRPQNFDKQYLDSVALLDALIRSRNLATIHLSQDIGFEIIQSELARLQLPHPKHAYPSLALGSVLMSPMDVAHLYFIFASGGHYAQLSVVDRILDHRRTLIQRFPNTTQAVYSEEATYLLNIALQQVMVRGTAKRAQHVLPQLTLAGKTGTSNDQRDSWFAGFSEDHLSVIWVGNDNNQTTQLTGSSGALRLFLALYQSIQTRPLTLTTPEHVHWIAIDKQTGRWVDKECHDSYHLYPFIEGFEPARLPGCEQNKQWWQRFF